jgi:hypothetical protein
MKPSVDVSRFPLVLVMWHDVPPEAELDAFGDDLRPVFERGSRFGSVAAIDKVLGASAGVRKHVSQRVEALALEFPGRFIAEAAFTSSALARGLFVAYTWLRRDKRRPTRCFATEADAVAWIKEELARAGVQ